MSNLLHRNSPSGPLVRSDAVIPDGLVNGQTLVWNGSIWVPSFPAVPAAGQSIGYTAGAPLVLQALAAGHAQGLYSIAVDVIVRTAAGAGSLTRSIQFSAPGFGLTGVGPFATVVITSTGHTGANYTSLTVNSSGATPITVTFTPVGITGSPVVDVYAIASFQGATS